MKKVSYISLFLLSVGLITSCNPTTPTEIDTNYKITKTVKSVEHFELTKQHTDISDKVKENSQVFVIQVNLTNHDLNKQDINSTLRNVRTDYLGEPLPEFINPRAAKPKSARAAADEEYTPPKEKDFYIVKNNYYSTTSKFILKAESKHAYIYYCPNIHYLPDGGAEGFLTDEEFKKIGEQFDGLYEAEINLTGSPEIRIEADNIIKTSKKIFICLCDLDEDAASLQESGNLGGYFTGRDYFKNDNNTRFSNECQAIYVDAVSVKREGSETGWYLGAIPHEFNHLINNSNKCFNPKNPNGTYNTWWTEMLSVMVPDLLNENSIYTNLPKGKTYDVGPWRFMQYNYFYNKGFRTWDEENYITYSLAYAYGSFLIRNYGGVELIHEFATNNYSNEESITKALEKLKQPSPFRENQYANFEDTVIDFALSTINFKVAEGSNLHTLNKAIDETFNGFRYTTKAIDLNEYKWINENYTNRGLRMFPLGEGQEIGDCGSLVQYAGTGTKELFVTLPEWEDVKMYCVIQHFE